MAFIDKRTSTSGVNVDGGYDEDLIFGSRFDDNLAGGDRNDEIHGGDGDDFIHEYALTFALFINHGGDDRFFGDGGDDTLEGLDGDDLLAGGDDNDELRGGIGDDTMRGGDGDDLLTETRDGDTNGGNDELFGGSGFDTLLSGSGDDILDGGSEDDILNGGSGNDTLDGGSGEDILNGGIGADVLHGGSGADVLDGGDLPANHYDGLVAARLLTRAAADALIAQSNAGDTATFNVLRAVDVDLERAVQIGGDAEGDTLTGIENLRGTVRADVLRGDDKANVLEGGAGSDLLEGRGGADALIGGNGGLGTDPGIDTASYASSDAAVNVDLIRATQTGGDAQGDTLSGIERLLGSRFGDQLRGDDADNVLDGGFGNDLIDGRVGSDTIDLSAWDVGPGLSARSVAVALSDIGDGSAVRRDFFRVSEIDTLRGIENVIGTNVADTIAGNGADNTLDGRSGNDVLNGGDGFDKLVGGLGFDTLNGGEGADEMSGGADDDTYIIDDVGDTVIEAVNAGTDLVESSVSYTLRSNVEHLTLTGGSDINGIGNDLANVLVGNSGNNILDGGADADIMRGGEGDDRYTFDNAGDRASELANEGTDTVISSVAHTLRPNFENLTIIGTATNAFGSSISNILTGNGLDNILNGKEANDIMTGDAGLDTFMFDTALGPANVDRITDFNPVDDAIRLDDAIFSALPLGTLAETAFQAGTAAADAADRIIYDQATGRIFYDADGLGGEAQVLFAILDNKPTTLSHIDFFLT